MQMWRETSWLSQYTFLLKIRCEMKWTCQAALRDTCIANTHGLLETISKYSPFVLMEDQIEMVFLPAEPLKKLKFSYLS